MTMDLGTFQDGGAGPITYYCRVSSWGQGVTRYPLSAQLFEPVHPHTGERIRRGPSGPCARTKSMPALEKGWDVKDPESTGYGMKRM